MRILVIGTVLGVLILGCRTDEYWTILPPAEAAMMNRPCTRPFPEGLAGSWEPSKAEIERAERKLPGAMDAAFARLQLEKRYHRAGRYYRQYGGFLRAGKRVLYINAFGRYTAENNDAWDSISQGWQERFIKVCDGGQIAFGAVYDLDKDEVDSFFFNGTIEGPLPGGGW